MINSYDKKQFSENNLQHLWELAEKSYQFGSPWTKEQFSEDFKNPQSRYLFANEPADAFLSYHQILDEIEIYNLAVLPAKKGQGIAKALLSELFVQAEKSQATVIFLEVRVSNLTAQNLYLSLGFEVIARRKNYYQNPAEDALIMEKKVRT